VDIDAVRRVASAFVSVAGTPDQASAAAQNLSEAANRYFTLSQASNLDPAAFRNYLETTPDEQATLAQVQKLEALLADVKKLGLPAVEYRQTRARLLASMASDRVPADVLAKTVEKQGS
jgi:hypothetical protein